MEAEWEWNVQTEVCFVIWDEFVDPLKHNQVVCQVEGKHRRRKVEKC